MTSERGESNRDARLANREPRTANRVREDEDSNLEPVS
jgi:hypothetical protein